MLKHKGYVGHVTYDDEAEIFHGEVINLRDVITFQATTARGLKKAFIESVEDYLAFCKQRGEKPEKPFSGNLVLRVPPDVHQAAYIAARHSGLSLNSWITKAIERESQKI